MAGVKELFERMPESFCREAASGLDVVILFDLSGEGGGQWQAAIKDGELRVSEGTHEAPNLTIRATAEDYYAIGTGALNETLAFMTGRITARGDTRLAMKLPKIFKR